MTNQVFKAREFGARTFSPILFSAARFGGVQESEKVYLLPYCDADGKQICTTLQDGVVLEWRNCFKYGNDLYADTGKTCESISISDGIITANYNGVIYENINFTTNGFGTGKAILNAVYSDSANTSREFWFANESVSVRTSATKNITAGTTLENKIFQFDIYGDTGRLVVRSNKVGTLQFKSLSLLKLDTLFTHHPNLLPTDATAFKAMFWSEGTESDKQLGYTAYTDEPTEVVVKDGKLWTKHKILEKLTDSEGRAVMANLPDGTRLRWRNSCDISTNRDLTRFVTGSVENGIATIVANGSQVSYARFGIKIYPLIQKSFYCKFEAIDSSSGTLSMAQYDSAGKAYVGFGGFPTNNETFSSFGFMSNTDSVYNTIGARNVYNTSGRTIKYRVNLLDMESMFQHCPSLLPKDKATFESYFHSEGTTELGYTPYTDDPIECVVFKGKIYKMPS